MVNFMKFKIREGFESDVEEENTVQWGNEMPQSFGKKTICFLPLFTRVRINWETGTQVFDRARGEEGTGRDSD